MQKQMQRRDFLKTTAIAGAGSVALPAIFSACQQNASEAATDQIYTVTGAIAASELGIALPHEHVMSIFGAPQAEVPEYDTDKLFSAVIPYLKKVGELGCNALFDCTAAYFGRAPELLQKISTESGVRLITNTGYYGAADDRYVPAFAYDESAADIAGRWLQEWQNGIGNSGIRPGFIKTGIDNGPLSEIDARLIRASAKTHLDSGLSIAAHSGDNPESVQQQLAILAEEDVSPQAWIWVHANKVKSAEPLLRAAEKGAWIELDGINSEEENNRHHLKLVKALKSAGYGEQILLSHDGNSFRATGRPPKPYEGLFTAFLPMLQEAGFSQDDIDQLIIRNPAKAFSVKVKAA
jgi:phosphotriesterase-related protein